MSIQESMKKYVGYFDLMGYKNFIEANDTAETERRVEHILRDVESALGQGEYKQGAQGVLHADLSASRLQCLTISDTIIFWTLDDSQESLMEILKVCFDFNFLLNVHNFPVRGALVFEEVDMITGSQRSNAGGTYSVNNIYGKGLVNAHIKAECQYWAGTVIDETAVQKMAEANNIEDLLAPFAMKTMVPYKNKPAEQEEYAFKLCKGELNEIAFSNWKRNIEDVFAADNKGMDDPGIIAKLANTIKFLELHKEKNNVNQA